MTLLRIILRIFDVTVLRWLRLVKAVVDGGRLDFFLDGGLLRLFLFLLSG